jgi:hypothetical protein
MTSYHISFRDPKLSDASSVSVASTSQVGLSMLLLLLISPTSNGIKLKSCFEICVICFKSGKWNTLTMW